ncbi:MAG TPA: hypothetical protein VEL06_10275 [Haliangiales bacterium]|nr:hypothetical protein [Haliangiales bacterium]
MNRNFQRSERGPWDFIMFGLAFFGFLFALGGVIAASAAVAVSGLLAMGLAFLFFGLQHWLSD